MTAVEAPAPSKPFVNLKVPWLASCWGKVLAAAGAVVVMLALVLSGRGPNTRALASQGITIQALGGSQLPKDPQVVMYTRELNALLGKYSASLDTLGVLSTKPQMSSGSWQAQLRRTTGALRAEDANLRLLTPPPCLASQHTQLLDAATGIDKASDRIDGSMRVQSTSGVEQWAQAALSVGGALKDLGAKSAGASGC